MPTPLEKIRAAIPGTKLTEDARQLSLSDRYAALQALSESERYKIMCSIFDPISGKFSQVNDKAESLLSADPTLPYNRKDLHKPHHSGNYALYRLMYKIANAKKKY